MRSSLIHLRGWGVWAENTLLSVWLCALTEEMRRVESAPEWLQVARDHWSLQARDPEWAPVVRKEWGAEAPEGGEGCIFVNLDGHLDEDKKISLVTELSERTLSRLEQTGPVLSPDSLDSLGLPSDAIREVEASPCVDLGTQWLALLRGEPYPERIRKVHYVKEFDGIAIAVTDQEVASDLWDFDALVPLSALEEALVSTSWQHPWIIMSSLVILLLGGLALFAVAVAGDEPAWERALVSVFGTILVVCGVVRVWAYFTSKRRELVVTTTEGKRGVLYMNQPDPTFFAFLTALKKAFAAAQQRELPSAKVGEPPGAVAKTPRSRK